MFRIFIILIFIVDIRVDAGRHAATHIVEIDETLSEVNDVISKASKDILNQYKSQTKEILEVIEELNNLHEATMPLILLLLNDSKSCENYLTVRRDEMDNVSASIAQSKLHLKIDAVEDASNLAWKSAHNATVHLESISDRLFDISMELLDKTKSSFTRTISDLIVTKTLQSEALTSKDVNTYMQKLNARITKIERSVQQTIAINSQFSKAKKEQQLKMVTEIQDVHHELRYSTHLNCSMVAIDDENPYIDYINPHDVHDLFKALSETQQDIEQIVNDSTFDSLDHTLIESLQNRVEKSINEIKNYYLLQRSKEKELQHQIKEALTTQNHTSLESIDYEFLRDINDVRNFINDIYQLTNQSLNETLAHAHKILFFPGTIAGIEQAVLNALEAARFFDDSIGFTMRQIEIAMRKRFALALNDNGTYGDLASMFLYNVYQLRDYYARELLLYAAKNIRTHRFIQNTDKNWLAEIELYLNSHLQLIIHSNCDNNLYEALGHGVQERVLRKVLAYVDVVRLLKPGDFSTMAKTSILLEVIRKYRYQNVDSRNTAGHQCGYYTQKYKFFEQAKGRTRVVDRSEETTESTTENHTSMAYEKVSIPMEESTKNDMSTTETNDSSTMRVIENIQTSTTKEIENSTENSESIPIQEDEQTTKMEPTECPLENSKDTQTTTMERIENSTEYSTSIEIPEMEPAVIMKEIESSAENSTVIGILEDKQTTSMVDDSAENSTIIQTVTDEQSTKVELIENLVEKSANIYIPDDNLEEVNIKDQTLDSNPTSKRNERSTTNSVIMKIPRRRH